MGKIFLYLILTILLFLSCKKSTNSISFEPEFEIKTVYVEGGTFNMGNTWGPPFYANEVPAHQVTVRGFRIGKYEVTQAQWKMVMGNNPSLIKGDDKPVEEVTWYNAVHFCNELSKFMDLDTCYTIINDTTISCDFSRNGYRLPTEAEWEYAARGGNKSNGYIYSGSNDIEDIAWYAGNISLDIHIHEVGQKLPNELGIYDMSGNCIEWCWDRFSFYADTAQVNPTGPETGYKRVRRNGGYYSPADRLVVSFRMGVVPTHFYHGHSFRLAQTVIH